ncbi:MAG: hypothetical protein JHC98_07865 [Thermoleophilaceae bacterium]|nr:hypothetical protein [Thermoleophilaceae bacterium]
MKTTFARRPAHLVAALVASLLLIAAAASTASAVTIGFKSFKTSIDVDLKLTEHTEFNGQRAGCFAPYEKWSHDYGLDIDSTPTRKSKSTKAITTVQPLVPKGTGTTYAFGAKGSFKQSSSNASWELTTQNPANCPAATAVPSWATSPTCKKISERVGASLIESGTEGTKEGDGILQIIRTPKAKPMPFGKSIGASCYRTLHSLETSFYDAEVGIGTTSTIITMPIPDLVEKLRDIGTGGAKERPSFKVRLRFWSVCNNYNMSPQGPIEPNWTKSPFTLPHQFLGAFNGEPERSKCTLSGSGWLKVTREGKVTRV